MHKGYTSDGQRTYTNNVTQKTLDTFAAPYDTDGTPTESTLNGAIGAAE